ncbi:MAG: hypothetical protein D6743_20045 [Calditrichaeota bacterium]|nr:MAG: hypothetical protein D6743_20045 [Calditrichota bacterium]
MKIEGYLLEAMPREFRESDGTLKRSVKVSVGIPHDDPAHGFQIVSGSLDPADFSPLDEAKAKFPRKVSCEVALSQRQVNGFSATVLRLQKVAG